MRDNKRTKIYDRILIFLIAAISTTGCWWNVEPVDEITAGTDSVSSDTEPLFPTELEDPTDTDSLEDSEPASKDSDSETAAETETESETDLNTDTAECSESSPCGNTEGPCTHYECTEGTCIEQPNLDFSPCEIVTVPSDFDLDFCINGNCISPGACEDASCNLTRTYVPLTPLQGHADYTRVGGDQPIVLDNLTDLTWQGCRAGYKGEDCSALDSSATAKMPLQKALEYCNSLEWGGYDDWYLPDAPTLQSIVEYSPQTPSINEDIFPNAVEQNSPMFHWASTKNPIIPRISSMVVAFRFGKVIPGDVNTAYYVRCVRREGLTRAPRFDRKVGSEPVVSERFHGLMWQGCTRGKSGNDCESAVEAEGVETEWNEVGAYCEDLVWAGYDDWRVPNVKEIMTIFDFQTAFTGGDSRVFLGQESALESGKVFAFWTSTMSPGNGLPLFYAMNGAVDWVVQIKMTSTVRCVRDDNL